MKIAGVSLVTEKSGHLNLFPRTLPSLRGSEK